LIGLLFSSIGSVSGYFFIGSIRPRIKIPSNVTIYVATTSKNQSTTFTTEEKLDVVGTNPQRANSWSDFHILEKDGSRHPLTVIQIGLPIGFVDISPSQQGCSFPESWAHRTIRKWSESRSAKSWRLGQWID
jgi:hypothetical protein